jgi:hypothetical protein
MKLKSLLRGGNKKNQCKKQINRERPKGTRISPFAYAAIIGSANCHLSLDIRLSPTVLLLMFDCFKQTLLLQSVSNREMLVHRFINYTSLYISLKSYHLYCK